MDSPMVSPGFSSFSLKMVINLGVFLHFQRLRPSFGRRSANESTGNTTVGRSFQGPETLHRTVGLFLRGTLRIYQDLPGWSHKIGWQIPGEKYHECLDECVMNRSFLQSSVAVTMAIECGNSKFFLNLP